MNTMAQHTPNVTLGQYKGLAVTRHVRPVLDRTIEQELTHRCRLHAYYTPTEGLAKRGDKVTFDSEGFLDGQPIPDSKNESATIILGAGRLTPALEQAFCSHKAGDTFQVDFTYPADFQVESLAGKAARFEIKLLAVAEKHIPAADEDFARSRGFASLDAMRAQIRKEKQALHEQAADRKAGQDLLDAAGANLTVALPEKVLDAEADREYKKLDARMKKSQMTIEGYCKACRTTPEVLRASFRRQAEKRMRSVLAAKAIAEAEGITVRTEEVNAEYRRLSVQHDTPEADIRKVLAPDAVAAALAAQKVQVFLLENAQVTTVVDPVPAGAARKEGE